MAYLSVDTLSNDRLVKAVSAEIFELGRHLHDNKQVQLVEVKENHANCIVHDKHPYRVEIKVAQKYLYLKCDCRYAYRGLVCAHDIAACLTVREYLQQKQAPTWRSQISRIIETTPPTPRKQPTHQYLLFFSLHQLIDLDYSAWKIMPYQLTISNLRRSGYPGDYSNEEELNHYIEGNSDIVTYLRSPYRPLTPAACINCTHEGVLLSNMLIESARVYPLTSFPQQLDEILTLINNSRSSLFLETRSHPLSTKLKIWEGDNDIRLHLSKDPDGIHIRAHIVLDNRIIELGNLPKSTKSQVLTVTPNWFLVEHDLFRLSETDQPKLLSEFLNTPEIIIPPMEENLFQQKYLLSLAKQYPLTGDLISWENIESVPTARVYLSEGDDGIQAEVRFVYHGIELQYDPKLPPQSIQQRAESWDLIRIKRQPEFEEQVLSDLSTPMYGLKRSPRETQAGVLHLRARVNPIEFLMHKLPLLTQKGYEVFGEDKIFSARANRNTPTINFSVSSGIDWFDVKTIVSFGDLEVTLKDIRNAIKKKQRFIQLSDGSIGELSNEWIDRYKHLFAFGNEIEGGLRLSRHHLVLIDEALANATHSDSDRNYAVYRNRLLNFSGINPQELPIGFTGELRPYQKAGYDWLHFLKEYSFGGCLADDMGLGKTIQALAYLQSLKEGINSSLTDEPTPSAGSMGKPKTSLLVVPRSLLVNWQREAARFTPNLLIHEYFSNRRTNNLSEFDRYDLIITTYGVMLRDISILRKYKFFLAILDESQVIKNPFSQTSRAARLLNAYHRLVLTGTPVENSTFELWSQFSYLNPGMLGNFEYFKTEFGTPIEAKGEKNNLETLRKLVYPFILRRTKDQVAPELPPRTDRILYCDMEIAQRKLYNRMRDYYRGIVMGMIEREGFNDSRFKILEGLLRLRQIANHPRLVDSQYHASSGKYDLLLETLETLRAEGHKALIFSQFVQMLRILRESLDENNVPYLYLDGHTRNRMEIVDRFQADPEIPLFLISLKAGGQGLNLTAADYVIHIDPWWNPAVEMQASDRTHRIGQDKPVFIYKLITRDSVEEKILLLQDRKKNLVDQLISADSNFYKSLSEDDVKLLFSN